MAPVHPQARAVLDAIAAEGAGGPGPRDIAELRRLQGVEARFNGPPQPVDAVSDERAGDVPVRVYRRHDSPSEAATLFIHGGGWALGSVAGSDHVCRALCRASGLLVASVEYRLAPEHPFPAGVDDVFTALEWLLARNGMRRVAVCGDSAGGNLAAALALRARDAGVEGVSLQVLIYPALDPARGERSMASLATGYGLTRDDMRFFWDTYLRSPLDASNPYASPLAADLAGVAPALILTAEYDPLVDEGERYARRLREAGVEVELHRYEGMIHGFVSYLGAVEDAQAAVDEIGLALRRLTAAEGRV